MKKYQFYIGLWTILILSYNVYSQEDKSNKLIFTLLNQNNEILQVPCCFFDVNTNKTIVSNTTDGLGEVSLYGNHTYYVYTRISSSYYPFQLPDVSGMNFKQSFVFVDSIKQSFFTIPDSALVQLSVLDYRKNSVSVEIVFRESNGVEAGFRTKSDSNGTAYVYLPLGRQYVLDFPNAKEYSTINIPNQLFYSVEKRIEYSGILTEGKVPSETNALISFRYIDLDKNPVKNEHITVYCKTSGIQYSDSTNNSGEAFILVPNGDSYTIGTTVNKTVTSITFAKDEKKAAFAMEYRDLPTEIYLKRKKEWEQRAKQAEEEWLKKKVENDSMTRLADLEWDVLKKNIELQNSEFDAEEALEIEAFKLLLDSIVRQDSIAEVRRNEEIERLREEEELRRIKVESEKKSKEIEKPTLEVETVMETKPLVEKIRDSVDLRKDSIAKTIWMAKSETKNNVWNNEPVIMRVLKRDPVLKPLIVVDATGSMQPYANQLHNWFVLNFSNNPKMNLVFFNDGDSKPDKIKEIGKTGGVHFCMDCGILGAKNVMRRALKYSGGDIPENDIEALLTAVDSVKEFEQLILVADNLAPIRDYELVSKLEIPVKIIVCGVKDNIINEVYLNLAKATKGFICTVENDISMNLNLKEGEFVEIGDQRYYFLNGKFVRK